MTYAWLEESQLLKNAPYATFNRTTHSPFRDVSVAGATFYVTSALGDKRDISRHNMCRGLPQ